jgi:tetratricopeptide (TPR) repeat protein
MDPGLRIYRLQAAEFWAHAGLSPGRDLQRQEMLRRAANLYASALEPAVHPLHRENYAWVLWALGDRSTALTEAAQAASETAGEAAAGPAIWLGTGAMYEATDEARSAVDAYARALGLSPGLMASAFWQATDFRQTFWDDIHAQAMADWIQAPSAVTALWLLQADGGSETLGWLADTWLETEPTSSSGLFAQALGALRQGEFEQAMQPANALCDQAPESVECYLLQGWTSLERGSIGEAVQNLQTVLFISPYGPYGESSAWLLAQLFRESDDIDEAWRWLDRATPPAPPFDTRDTQVYGRRVVVAPLRVWPSIRPLPLGGAAWRTGIRWAEAGGSLERLAYLCQTSEQYDPTLELCADVQP